MSSPRKNTQLSKRLAQLRHALGVDKGHFTEDVLNMTRGAMQHWETGRSTPTAETFIKLAKLSIKKLPSASIWFLKQAGIDLKELRAIAPEIEKSLSERERPARAGEIFEIPYALIGQHTGTEESLPFPGSLIRNRAATTYLRISGDRMQPIFADGDAIVLDESETDPWKLTGKLVAFFRPIHVFSHEETVERQRTGKEPSAGSHAPTGVIAGLLRTREQSGIRTLWLEGMRGDGEGLWQEMVAMDVESRPGSEAHLLSKIRLIGRIIASVSPHAKKKDE